ncbi:MAG: BrnT family toxin [Holosporaceae bacterium]|nr:BrnT family toxin [Rhodospirillaceae bacterium]
MRWTWSEAKNKANKLKHGLSFETAQLVFDDPHAISRRDPFPEEERWQTVGMIGYVVIFVVHSWPEDNQTNGEELGRIISARKATKQERNAYEKNIF